MVGGIAIINIGVKKHSGISLEYWMYSETPVPNIEREIARHIAEATFKNLCFPDGIYYYSDKITGLFNSSQMRLKIGAVTLLISSSDREVQMVMVFLELRIKDS
ncbi:hypothetical protein M3P05_20315 [Sansalvadorimonas sp. 2012CJ34-2]|uniref:Uncharacterized protein n=1 Tax=Parendozoicomonas callyspongiae TaxID=2942213 RepID=A0ABT0PLL3_9GAMM|nr:hypothetical protein [Sansalvadorimonas sp. 2012CJ34-2]MCL6272267.1 hypothetical protein [Sansalvadorimonas sp. 2012CJ34-2]